MPTESQLQHISITREQLATTEQSTVQNTNTPITTCISILGAGLPPVPAKLVSKIESGAFIEMADLLPEQLGTYYSDEEPKARTKKPSVTNIMEWLQCFAVYVAVRCQKQPERIRDIMGYQALIIDAYMEYKGDCWMGYDRRFRQITASQPERSWASIDPTLWNLAFAGQAKTARCMHCFSLSHHSNDCEFASRGKPQRSYKLLPTEYRPQRKPICFQWNENPSSTCPHQNCRFQHICYICAYDPMTTDVSHKAVYCPKRRGLSTSQGAAGPSSSKGIKPKPLMPSWN